MMIDGRRSALEKLPKSQTASHREVQRAQVLLIAADGLANKWVAKVAGGDAGNGEGLGKVRAERGRKPVIPQSKIDKIVN